MKPHISCRIGIVLCLCLTAVCAQETHSNINSIETFLVEPTHVDILYCWVPADKVGPTINWSCQADVGCLYTNSLATQVDHEKQQDCPERMAAMLAEYIAMYHQEKVPLTMFNGWQWEYTYDLSQFEATSYTLTGRGGGWESAWESVLCLCKGVKAGQWVKVDSDVGGLQNSNRAESTIVVRTFYDMRTRNGYPKEGQFSSERQFLR